jgi:hypothetical protein
MLDSFAALAHLLWILVESTLHCIDNKLMLPSGDPSLFASGALSFDGATLTGIGPYRRRTNPFSSVV